MLDPLPQAKVPVDKALGQIAGWLRARTAEAGVSLDAAIVNSWQIPAAGVAMSSPP